MKRWRSFIRGGENVFVDEVFEMGVDMGETRKQPLPLGQLLDFQFREEGNRMGRLKRF